MEKGRNSPCMHFKKTIHSESDREFFCRAAFPEIIFQIQAATLQIEHSSYLVFDSPCNTHEYFLLPLAVIDSTPVPQLASLRLVTICLLESKLVVSIDSFPCPMTEWSKPVFPSFTLRYLPNHPIELACPTHWHYPRRATLVATPTSTSLVLRRCLKA